MKKQITALAFLTSVTACSTSGPKPQVDNSPVYKLIATAQTKLSTEGDTCGDAIGTIRLYKNGIYGSAQDTFGRGFKITGKINSEGIITGGFAISIVTAVDFKGQLDPKKEYATGTWEDLYQCKGTWKASRVIG